VRRGRGRLMLLVVLAIALAIVTTSCSFRIIFSIPTTPAVKCSLEVVSQAFSVGGYIYVNGNYTGEFLKAFGSKTIYNVPCYQNVAVYIIDPYGYPSHTEYVYTRPGAGENIVYFYWW